jgi:hypothetical protein
MNDREIGQMSHMSHDEEERFVLKIRNSAEYGYTSGVMWCETNLGPVGKQIRNGAAYAFAFNLLGMWKGGVPSKEKLRKLQWAIFCVFEEEWASLSIDLIEEYPVTKIMAQRVLNYITTLGQKDERDKIEGRIL